MNYLQVRHQGTSIGIHFVGNVTPEVLRYLARFALFQAQAMDDSHHAGELEYASWFSACPNAQHMGEHACANKAQCWEPCGELGHSAEHARPSSAAGVEGRKP